MSQEDPFKTGSILMRSDMAGAAPDPFNCPKCDAHDWGLNNPRCPHCGYSADEVAKCNDEWNARYQRMMAEEERPVAWTERELELFDGMIEVQRNHAEQARRMAERPGGNKAMAEKQIGWDEERIALLEKCKALAVRREGAE